MTGIGQKHTGILPLLLAGALLLGSSGGLLSGTQSATQFPKLPQHQSDYISNAVVIKTQKAADKILKQGGIRGIDVSKYQGDIDWAKVAKSDVQFAFIRASYGTTKDPYFLTNARSAHENGIKVGAYHYATFKNEADVEAEAAYFLKRIKKVDITYPVVLDLESNTHKQMSKSTLTSLAVQFMDRVRAEGYDVMLYSYNNFIQDHLDLSSLGNYKLWIANYLENPTAASHVIWQHTASGSVKGISGNVDINVAYSDLSTSRSSTSSSSSGSVSSNIVNTNIENEGQLDQDSGVLPESTPVSAPQDSGDSSVIKVSKSISDSIKATLNQRYNVGIPLDGLNMDTMNQAITYGIQSEINRQWEISLPVDGYMTAEQVEELSTVTFTNATNGNITYLLQAKLFYKGHYSGELTSWFDNKTVAAVRAFQAEAGIESNGELDHTTLYALLT